MRRLRNAPLGRALIGVALGGLVFVVHLQGAFRGPDLAVLDFVGSLAPTPANSQSLVLVACPTGRWARDPTTIVQTSRAAIANVLAAGAASVGIDHLFFQDALGNDPTAIKSLSEVAKDPRCVVAVTSGDNEAGPVDAMMGEGIRTAQLESLLSASGVARWVKSAQSTQQQKNVGGLIAQLVTTAASTQRWSPRRLRIVKGNLRRLASPEGLLIDYSLPVSTVSEVSLEALARGPVSSLYELVKGRVVLLLATPHAVLDGPEHLGLSARPSHRDIDCRPAVAWAIATVLAGPAVRELRNEVYGSSLILLGLVLMLVFGARSLRGKLTGAGIALFATLSLCLASRVCGGLFIPPWPVAATIALALLVSAGLELAEAGYLIDRELRPQSSAAATSPESKAHSPRAETERTLQSIVRWHDLPAAALTFSESARSPRMAVIVGNGPVTWQRAPSLHSLTSQALRVRSPVLGTWPSALAEGGKWHALAIPVVGWGGQRACLVLAAPQLPVPHECVEFAVRATRQLLAARTAGMPGRAPRDETGGPEQLPLPERVAWLRSARMGRQRQAALAAAWRSGVHEAVILFDMAGKPVVWNRRAEMLFGEDEEDLARGHLVPLLAKVSGLAAEQVRQAATEVLLHGTPFICDLEDPSGKHNYVATLTQVAVDGEAPGGLVIRCIDVTGVCRPARVEARLMSVAAHEMRTPLTSILGYSELLLKHTDRDSLARRYAAAIHRQAGRVEAIVRELLAVTRLEAGREEMVIEPVDVATLARYIVSAAEPLARDHGVSLAVEVEAEETEIRGDVRKLERVVENLVSNAIKYSPPGASVTVSVRRVGDRIQLSVADTGYGIPEKEAPHVFEKFYRVKNRHTQAVAGTGLGLAIVKLIVEAHGGEVTLRTAEGVGSTFTVSLPVAGPPAHRASSSAA